MQGRKKYIIVLVVLVIYLVGMLLFFRKDIMKNKVHSLYLIASPNTQWQFVEGSWSDVKKVTNYSMKSFQTYIDNKFIGTYNITFNDKFYLFDDDRNSKKFEGELLAFRGSLELDVIDFSNERTIENDLPIIKKVLNENNLNIPTEKLNMWKSNIDIDNDSKLETIYSVDNLFKENIGSSAIGLVFVVDDDNISYIYKKIDPVDYNYNMCMPYLKHVIDIDKDKQYEFIVGCVYYSDYGTCNNLYDNKKHNYTILKGC